MSDGSVSDSRAKPPPNSCSNRRAKAVSSARKVVWNRSEIRASSSPIRSRVRAIARCRSAAWVSRPSSRVRSAAYSSTAYGLTAPSSWNRRRSWPSRIALGGGLGGRSVRPDRRDQRRAPPRGRPPRPIGRIRHRRPVVDDAVERGLDPGRRMQPRDPQRAEPGQLGDHAFAQRVEPEPRLEVGVIRRPQALVRGAQSVARGRRLLLGERQPLAIRRVGGARGGERLLGPPARVRRSRRSRRAARHAPRSGLVRDRRAPPDRDPRAPSVPRRAARTPRRARGDAPPRGAPSRSSERSRPAGRVEPGGRRRAIPRSRWPRRPARAHRLARPSSAVGRPAARRAVSRPAFAPVRARPRAARPGRRARPTRGRPPRAAEPPGVPRPPRRSTRAGRAALLGTCRLDPGRRRVGLARGPARVLADPGMVRLEAAPPRPPTVRPRRDAPAPTLPDPRLTATSVTTALPSRGTATQPGGSADWIARQAARSGSHAQRARSRRAAPSESRRTAESRTPPPAADSRSRNRRSRASSVAGARRGPLGDHERPTLGCRAP